MKLVFVLVSLIAAFMVDCRSQPGPDSQQSSIAEQPQWSDLTLEHEDSEEVTLNTVDPLPGLGFTLGHESDIETSGEDELGPPISPEEFAAAMANQSLMAPPPVLTEYACEHSGKELKIECNAGSFINVIKANYGRLSRTICNPKNSDLPTNCSSQKSYSVLTERCSGKRSCNVAASNNIFGDPCHGTRKYLEVDYSCIAGSGSHTAYACQLGGKELKIECNAGSAINVIKANYGRLSRTICNPKNSDWPTNCTSQKSYSVLTERCSGKRSCSVVASNNIFGNPCYGTWKYLEVDYSCITVLTAYACEHSGKELKIECNAGRVINVIWANYGRLSRTICNPKNSDWPTNCRSQKSYSVLKERCNGKRSCNVAASNNIFGDPCHGTLKYLEVEYICNQ